ncbi:methyltransferase, FxLD system [Kribbella sp. NPDC051587]|uniref:methyltransferase, FxLD system n=1 Tax=Kribbella sp. NPDC051587 TaxID=3364119 RepID=UPI0037AAE257
MTTITNSPETLRAAMVDNVKAAGHATSPAVEQAMRSVPRHAFVPEASVEDAYADIAVITKSASDGSALSCASVPTIVGMMLDQLQVQPGNRILEIGAGTGYNAALLARLTGPGGSVTTVDIDPEVTAGARRALGATGNERVEVITRDGSLGAQENAPYDRIIFTVGAWDLTPAFWEQLAPGGRLVVPLRWRGQTRSVAFVREGDALVSDSMELCGFVPMLGQEGERSATIDRGDLVTLYWDVDQAIDTEKLQDVLDQPKQTSWSGVTVGPYDSFDGIWLRMSATASGTCRIAAGKAAVESELCTPAIAVRSPALADHDSLAYLATRRVGDSVHELGAIGHGTYGLNLAAQLSDQIAGWNENRDALPALRAYRTDVPNAALTFEPNVDLGQIIEKTESRLMINLT